jgi:hypothetical protein
MRWIVLLCALAGALAWGVLLYPGARDQMPEATPADDTALLGPGAETPEPESPRAPTQELAAAPAAAPTAPTPSAPTAEPGAPLDRPPTDETLPTRMGPVDQLRARYDEDSRDSAAGPAEQRIRDLFGTSQVPAELLRRVICTQRVCKLELRWSRERHNAYVIVMMSLVGDFSQELAADTPGADLGGGVHPIEVFVSREAPPLKADVEEPEPGAQPEAPAAP